MSASKQHRLAVVGCGALAQLVHLPNAQKNPRVELTAVCDIDPATAERCREKFGARRAETDWRRIVQDADIDLCILATHTNLRGEFIIPALEAGKPVYTEKPLAPDRAEMLAIVRAVRRTGVPVCVGHNRRSSPAVLELKRLLEKARTAKQTDRPSVDRGQVTPEQVPEAAGLQVLMRINDDVRSWKSWIFMADAGCMFVEMVHFLDLALW
ncbi:MAG: Gfo/Idh/MocA family oxidoreductase, partial [Lentisphaerae bacterium]|nr:Gfo/Idh/MocA family oxidoreductase [Lentisphaerota bacterium]